MMMLVEDSLNQQSAFDIQQFFGRFLSLSIEAHGGTTAQG
jgi:hypothetical protein